MGNTLQFRHETTFINKRSRIWTPPCIPPPDSWPVSVDKDGNVISLYGDDVWDYSAFGSRSYNFGSYALSEKNMRLVKQALLVIFYHPQMFPGKIDSCRNYFIVLCRVSQVCDEYGILLSELSHFPKLHGKLLKALKSPNREVVISILHKLLFNKDDVGFTIANDKTISFLAGNLARKKDYNQHPYIPPRIWNYQLMRLDECILDYIQHQDSIEEGYNWLLDAYSYNLHQGLPKKYTSPFSCRDTRKSERIIYEGNFECFLKEYELYDLVERWRNKEKKLDVRSLSSYLSSVVQVSMFYIMNFSMQRASEAASLKDDCYQTENDERIGEIPLIVGETTKTDPDSDARWIVPKNVKKAIDVASSISRLRMRFNSSSSYQEDIGRKPLALFYPAREPWVPNTGRGEEFLKTFINYKYLIARTPGLFDPDKIKITEEDWKIAVALTPTLKKREDFGIGLPWGFSAHQLRRTTCVNMFLSDRVSESSMQWAMKHHTPHMTLYYARNYTKLRMNSEAEKAVILESYQEIYRQLGAITGDAVEYVRPNGNEVLASDVISLVEEKEERELLRLIKKGRIGSRRTLLGYCMKADSCEYGGIESVVKCTGDGREGVCADAIFVRKNKPGLINLRKAHKRELKTLDKDTPRYNALKKEIYAIGVYLNAIER